MKTKVCKYCGPLNVRRCSDVGGPCECLCHELTAKVAAARAAAERLRYSEHDVNIGAKKDADLALVLAALDLALQD